MQDKHDEYSSLDLSFYIQCSWLPSIAIFIQFTSNKLLHVLFQKLFSVSYKEIRASLCNTNLTNQKVKRLKHKVTYIQNACPSPYTATRRPFNSRQLNAATHSPPKPPPSATCADQIWVSIKILQDLYDIQEFQAPLSLEAKWFIIN